MDDQQKTLAIWLKKTIQLVKRNLLGYNNIGMGDQPNKAFQLKKSTLKRLLV
jgi:hypothetical protein